MSLDPADFGTSWIANLFILKNIFMALKLSLHMIQIVCGVYLVAIIFNTPINTQNNLGIPFL